MSNKTTPTMITMLSKEEHTELVEKATMLDSIMTELDIQSKKSGRFFVEGIVNAILAKGLPIVDTQDRLREQYDKGFDDGYQAAEKDMINFIES